MKTILVVDDEYAIAEALRALLEDEGYRVLTASNGAEALDLLTSYEPPDMILLDVMMPVLDGRETHKRLREDPRFAAIPVMLMSAAAQVTASDGTTGTMLLRKPFNLELLLDTVKALTGERT